MENANKVNEENVEEVVVEKKESWISRHKEGIKGFCIGAASAIGACLLKSLISKDDGYSEPNDYMVTDGSEDHGIEE